MFLRDMSQLCNCIFILVASLLVTSATGDCPSSCSCGKWKNGKETTYCLGTDFKKIPQGLPPTTQVLDLTGNKLEVLYDFTFFNKSLVNLQRLYLPKCTIQEIRPNAFSQLSNLIELDLSFNNLEVVPSQAFAGTPALRQLNMKGNSISFIQADSFTFTPSIVSLDISASKVTRVAPEAFQALSMLESLKLQNNQLKELPRQMIEGLAAIHNLEVHDNFWICDCRILPLWRLLIRLRVSHPITPSCNVPSRLQGSKFDILTEEDLACPPEILPGTRFVEGFEGENTSLACRVWGEPAPRVQWYIDEKEITNSEKGRLVSLIKHKGNGDTISSLLISETKETDSGFLRCEAINPAGRVSANFTLAVKSRPLSPSGFTLIHIAVVSAAVVLISIIIAVIILVYGKSTTRNNSNGAEKQRESSPSSVVVCASPNPIQKPPRMTELTNSNSTDPDIISNLANGYPATTSTASVLPGDYTRVEGDSLYPSGIWEENNKTREQILHEHFNPGFVSSDSPRHGPAHSTPSRNDPHVDPKIFGYPSDYGLPMPEVEHQDQMYASDIRMSSPISNPNQMYDSRQELALYNSTSEIGNSRSEIYHQMMKPSTIHEHMSPMYEMVEVGNPSNSLMPSHVNLHDSGHQDSSPGLHDEHRDEEDISLNGAGERPWIPGALGRPGGVPMGVPVLPPLPNGTLHRIKPRDSPDEGYQEGTEV